MLYLNDMHGRYTVVHDPAHQRVIVYPVNQQPYWVPADTIVVAMAGSILHVYGSVKVIALNNSRVDAKGGGVDAREGSYVDADNCRVLARAGAIVIAHEGSTIRALSGSIVTACLGSTILEHRGARITRYGGAKVIQENGRIEDGLPGPHNGNSAGR